MSPTEKAAITKAANAKAAKLGKIALPAQTYDNIAIASAMFILKSITLIKFCKTVVMMRAPPGEPVASIGPCCVDTITGVIEATPCTVTTFADAVPAVPGAEPAIVVVSCDTVTLWAPVPLAPAPVRVVTALTCARLTERFVALIGSAVPPDTP